MATPEELKDQVNALLTVVDEVNPSGKVADTRELMILHLLLLQELVNVQQAILNKMPPRP